MRFQFGEWRAQQTQLAAPPNTSADVAGLREARVEVAEGAREPKRDTIGPVQRPRGFPRRRVPSFIKQSSRGIAKLARI